MINPGELRPTVVDVELDAIEHNYQELRALVHPAAVMPIVKANAYGHGLVVCSQHLERLGAPMLGVALVEEGIALRKAGIKIPILVLGGIAGSQIKFFLDYDLDLLASSVFKLDAIQAEAESAGKRARVHLEVDTGMERIGIHYYSAESLFERALECDRCDIVGVSSHFATAEDKDPTFAKLQLERFLETISFFEKRSLPTPTRHIAASGAILQLPESRLDMVRPGLALYGIMPAPHLRGVVDLHPALSIRSQVAYFKVVKSGTGVSYGLTWTAPEDVRVVTVPVGYGDGFRSKLSNCGHVLIRGQRYPIVGRVCMDQFMVNIGNNEAYNGDDVVLLGAQGDQQITVEEIAEQIGENPREFLVLTNLRIPRRYRSKGEYFIPSEFRNSRE